MALSEQAGRRKKQAARGALGETGQGRSLRGQHGAAGAGWARGEGCGHGLAARWPARRPSPRPVLQAALHVVFTLLSVSVFTGRQTPPVAAAFHNPGSGLAKALFSLWTLGLWTGSQTWSPGAACASVSVTDSLGPQTLSLSFPICHITRLMVWQMFFGSRRVSSNDVQCQSPEYKAESTGGPGDTWLKGPPPLALVLTWKRLQFGSWGAPCGPPLASSSGKKATGCVLCCARTQRTPHGPQAWVGARSRAAGLGPLVTT